MREILKLATSQLRAKPFNTTLSIVMFTIGMSIISVLMHFEDHAQQRMENDIAGIDMVIGAKGSPLQLVLSSVFHADNPTGNISLQDAERVKQHPLVKKAVPIALGDNYKGYRIVGSNSEYAQLYKAKLADGQWNKKVMDVVIGSKVAYHKGLRPGDQFTGVHGFMDVGHSHDEYIYTVTGIMNENGSVIDKIIVTNIESVWAVHGGGHGACEHEHEADCQHDHHEDIDHIHSKDCQHDHATEEAHVHGADCQHDHHESDEHKHSEECQHNHDADGEHSHEHDTQSSIESIINKVNNNQELTAEEMSLYNAYRGHISEKQLAPDEAITALLVFYKNPMAATTLPHMINQNTSMQAASPAIELNRLMAMLGVGFTTIRLLAWIIIIFSAINLLIHMLNRLNQELNEIALLRSLGISRFKALLLLLSHGLILAVSGWFLSIITTRIALVGLSHYFEQIDFHGLQSLLAGEYYLLLYAIGIGALAALIPALKAYNTNIHYLFNKL
ncbi:ABC transporter permease [Carboxylicivirga sp. RSCT41]|uniref:ABC transporter permease n=1 Tax=Carboxylicivirga agarovorans TaxID=3417570 RepID=UPI003D35966D